MRLRHLNTSTNQSAGHTALVLETVMKCMQCETCNVLGFGYAHN